MVLSIYVAILVMVKFVVYLVLTVIWHDIEYWNWVEREQRRADENINRLKVIYSRSEELNK